MAGASFTRSCGGSRLVSSAPRAAPSEKAMVPVLVLPCAMGPAGACAAVSFQNGWRCPVFDRGLILIEQTNITRATIAFTSAREAGWTES
jgi:hypothetical protein